ncbi:MAG: cupin domain-containing protein [Candidatus Hydrogenedentes bacterium]|nr:cupin domain-containing protein [Candidatus Hydrogenedentota bacterium]
MSNLTVHSRIRDAIEIQRDSIVSKTVFAGDHAKVVLMALDAGQELSEHTAAMPAVIHLIEGEADVTLGDDAHRLAAGAWVHMPAHRRHSMKAVTPTVLLLTLFKKG